jgi:hypothetical protein
LAISLFGRSAWTRTFADILSTPVEQVFAKSLSESIGRSLPLVAASSGIVFRFDPESGAFVRSTSILGQLFLERATPIGRGRWNLSLSYQWVRSDTFYGKDLGRLSDTTPIVDDPRNPQSLLYTIPHFGIDLITHEVAASVTYGLTDDLEVNLTVPVLYSDFTLGIVQKNLGGVTSQAAENVNSSKLGIGDIALRAKYRIVERDWAEVAFGLVLQVPSGNQDNFQGTGAVELAPLLYASREPVPVGSWVQLRPYLNGGVNLDANDVGASEARYGVGLDAEVGKWGTAAVAFVARQEFQRIGPPGVFDFTRENQAGERFQAPLFGIHNTRSNFFNLSVGGSVNLWRDTLIGFGNVIIPLNSSEFRPEPIPTVGFEAAF